MACMECAAGPMVEMMRRWMGCLYHYFGRSSFIILCVGRRWNGRDAPGALSPPPKTTRTPTTTPTPSCATLATAFANMPGGSAGGDVVFWGIAAYTYANALLNFCVVYRHPAFTARNRFSPAVSAEQAAKDAAALEVATAHYVRTHPHEVLRVLRNMHGISASNYAKTTNAMRAQRPGMATGGRGGGGGGGGERAGAGAFFGSSISNSGGGGGGGGGGGVAPPAGASPRPGFEPRSRRKSFGAGEGDAGAAVPDWTRGSTSAAEVPDWTRGSTRAAGGSNLAADTGSSRMLNPFGGTPSPRLPEVNPFSTPRLNPSPARRPSMHGDR
jgi:hypothetical protein